MSIHIGTIQQAKDKFQEIMQPKDSYTDREYMHKLKGCFIDRRKECNSILNLTDWFEIDIDAFNMSEAQMLEKRINCNVQLIIQARAEAQTELLEVQSDIKGIDNFGVEMLKEAQNLEKLFVMMVQDHSKARDYFEKVRGIVGKFSKSKYTTPSICNKVNSMLAVASSQANSEFEFYSNIYNVIVECVEEQVADGDTMCAKKQNHYTTKMDAISAMDDMLERWNDLLNAVDGKICEEVRLCEVMGEITNLENNDRDDKVNHVKEIVRSKPYIEFEIPRTMLQNEEPFDDGMKTIPISAIDCDLTGGTYVQGSINQVSLKIAKKQKLSEDGYTQGVLINTNGHSVNIRGLRTKKKPKAKYKDGVVFSTSMGLFDKNTIVVGTIDVEPSETNYNLEVYQMSKRHVEGLTWCDDVLKLVEYYVWCEPEVDGGTNAVHATNIKRNIVVRKLKKGLGIRNRPRNCRKDTRNLATIAMKTVADNVGDLSGDRAECVYGNEASAIIGRDYGEFFSKRTQMLNRWSKVWNLNLLPTNRKPAKMRDMVKVANLESIRSRWGDSWLFMDDIEYITGIVRHSAYIHPIFTALDEEDYTVIYNKPDKSNIPLFKLL